ERVDPRGRLPPENPGPQAHAAEVGARRRHVDRDGLGRLRGRVDPQVLPVDAEHPAQPPTSAERSRSVSPSCRGVARSDTNRSPLRLNLYAGCRLPPLRICPPSAGQATAIASIASPTLVPSTASRAVPARSLGTP